MHNPASQISSILRTDSPRRRRAFTLVEVIVSSAIGSFVLIGVLTSFLMIGRTSANIQNYTALEAEARKALELFSREARLAYAVTTASPTVVVMSITDTSSNRTGLAYTVTYTFDPDDGTAAHPGTLVRNGPPIDNPTGLVGNITIIAKGINQIPGVNLLNYYRYVTGGGYATGFTSNIATNLVELKQIEISFLLKLQSRTVVTASNKVFSARFTLRNK